MSRPNLLFIFTDEQRADTMAAYGNPLIQTPNLNRLSARSCIFDRAYVTQPVCTPSRASLMTGLWPHTSGCTENNVPLDADTPVLAEMLPAGGYHKAYMGKWHLGDEIFRQHGFDEWVSIEDGYHPWYSEGRDPDAKSSYTQWLISQGLEPANGKAFGRAESVRLPEQYTKPAFLAQEASRYLREHRDDPFCLCINFLEPHMPFFGPRDDQHDVATIPLPENFDCPPGEDQHLKCRLFARCYYNRGHSRLPLQTPDQWRRMIANYWGLCSLVDTAVGDILQTLSDCGLDENTIVVFTSDHGDMMGSHRLLAKCVQFEEAVRVPLLVSLPGQREGRRIPHPVSQVDLVPTLLDLMDQPTPDHLEGKSLRPAMEGRGEGEDVIIEWNGMNNGFGDVRGGVSVPEHMRDGESEEACREAIGDSIRTILTPDGWKFNCSTIGQHELYDLNADGLETRNLAGEPGQQQRMRELHARIVEWQKRTGDTVDLSDALERNAFAG